MRLIKLLLLFYTLGLCHPHTFIEVKPTLEISNSKINKIHIRWELDEMTSMMLINELDSNGNGKFEKNENDFIYEDYFSSLSKYNFYMQILNNKKNFLFSPINFKASIEKGKLIYAFDIKTSLALENIKMNFYDEELFVGMIIKKEYITLKGANKNKVEKLKKIIFGV